MLHGPRHPNNNAFYSLYFTAILYRDMIHSDRALHVRISDSFQLGDTYLGA